MTPEAREALEASIAHWRRAVEDAGEPLGANDCALCEMFYGAQCLGCPVFSATSQKRCRGTPYLAAYEADCSYEYGRITDTERRAAAQAELDFLISLRDAESDPA